MNDFTIVMLLILLRTMVHIY